MRILKQNNENIASNTASNGVLLLTGKLMSSLEPDPPNSVTLSEECVTLAPTDIFWTIAS